MYCVLTCDLSWRMFHVHSKWIYVLLWGRMFCLYLLSPSGLMCHSKTLFPYWFSAQMIYSWCKGSVKVPIPLTIFPVLYLLLIHYMTESLYLPLLFTFFACIPTCPHFGNISLFSVFVCVSAFCLFIHLCVFFLTSTYMWSHLVFIFLCLTYFT